MNSSTASYNFIVFIHSSQTFVCFFFLLFNDVIRKFTLIEIIIALCLSVCPENFLKFRVDFHLLFGGNKLGGFSYNFC